MRQAVVACLFLLGASGYVYAKPDDLRASTYAKTDDLPVPPQPPDHAPAADNAPVPNLEALGPIQPQSEDPSLNVKLYRFTPPDPSHGFSPGSRYQSSEDRKAIQTPGFSFTVPLK